MAEFFEIITWKHLGLHDKPVLVLNSYHYWDDLFAMLEKAGNENFLYEDTASLFKICADLNDLQEKLLL